MLSRRKRVRCLSVMAVIDAPSIKMSPLFGISIPLIRLSRVLFAAAAATQQNGEFAADEVVIEAVDDNAVRPPSEKCLLRLRMETTGTESLVVMATSRSKYLQNIENKSQFIDRL